MGIWNWFTGTFLPNVPVIGPLTRCRSRHHVKASKEFFVTLCFSTATFWVTAVFLRAFSQNSAKTAGDLLLQTSSSGQLFIFAVGFLGPILIVAAEDPEKAKVFPGRTWHFLILILLALFSAGFYSLQLTSIGGAEKSFVDTKFLFGASVAIALCAAALRYLTIVYRALTLDDFDPEVELKAPVKSFAQRFADKHVNDGSGEGAQP